VKEVTQWPTRTSASRRETANAHKEALMGIRRVMPVASIGEIGLLHRLPRISPNNRILQSQHLILGQAVVP
jgi:hypothetical protein